MYVNPIIMPQGLTDLSLALAMRLRDMARVMLTLGITPAAKLMACAKSHLEIDLLHAHHFPKSLAPVLGATSR